MEQSTDSLAADLRHSTWDLHQAAEKHPGHSALLKGEVPFDFFLDQSAQMLIVQRALEESLRSVRTDPVLAPLVHDYHLRSALLADDLVASGREADGATPMPATRGLLDRIEAGRSDPSILVGVLYVLEGSTNGAKFIAKALQRAYRLADGPPLRWLDPHGDAQPERWSRFREALATLPLSAAQRGAAIRAARETFQWVIGVLDELCAQYAVGAGRPGPLARH